MKIPHRIALSTVESMAKKIAANMKGGEIIALTGELGAGKTTFTKALGKALGVKESIPSPTFVIMQQFSTAKKSHNNRTITLYHLDLYRTSSFAEVTALGITEWWGHPETITVIEWADKIRKHLPRTASIIELYRDV